MYSPKIMIYIIIARILFQKMFKYCEWVHIRANHLSEITIAIKIIIIIVIMITSKVFRLTIPKVTSQFKSY